MAEALTQPKRERKRKTKEPATPRALVDMIKEIVSQELAKLGGSHSLAAPKKDDRVKYEAHPTRVIEGSKGNDKEAKGTRRKKGNFVSTSGQGSASQSMPP